MTTAKQDTPMQQASSCLPDEALVRVSQVAPHGIALNAGEAVVGRLARHIHSAGAIGLKPSAGHHQPFTRQYARQSAIAAAVATAGHRLLHRHTQRADISKNANDIEPRPVARPHRCRSVHRPRVTPRKQRIHI